MAMKVKAVERLVKFNKNDAGTYRYVLAPELYSSIRTKNVKDFVFFQDYTIVYRDYL